jgi:hypothetical protein
VSDSILDKAIMKVKRTPADVAGIKLPFKTWTDFVRNYKYDGHSIKIKIMDFTLPHIGEMVADVIVFYENKMVETFPDRCIGVNEPARNYSHAWLEMIFKRGQRIIGKREYYLATDALKKNKS